MNDNFIFHAHPPPRPAMDPCRGLRRAPWSSAGPPRTSADLRGGLSKELSRGGLSKDLFRGGLSKDLFRGGFLKDLFRGGLPKGLFRKSSAELRGGLSKEAFRKTSAEKNPVTFF